MFWEGNLNNASRRAGRSRDFHKDWQASHRHRAPGKKFGRNIIWCLNHMILLVLVVCLVVSDDQRHKFLWHGGFWGGVHAHFCPIMYNYQGLLNFGCHVTLLSQPLRHLQMISVAGDQSGLLLVLLRAQLTSKAALNLRLR